MYHRNQGEIDLGLSQRIVRVSKGSSYWESTDHKTSLFTPNSLSLTILLKTKSQKKKESSQGKSVSGIVSDLKVQ